MHGLVCERRSPRHPPKFVHGLICYDVLGNCRRDLVQSGVSPSPSATSVCLGRRAVSCAAVACADLSAMVSQPKSVPGNLVCSKRLHLSMVVNTLTTVRAFSSMGRPDITYMLKIAYFVQVGYKPEFRERERDVPSFLYLRQTEREREK